MAGVLSRVWAALKPPAVPVQLQHQPGDTEQRRRAGAPIWADFGAGPITSMGAQVNGRLAENISAVVACINVIAGPISSVPALVYKAVPGGREEDPTHPVAQLIRRPNQRQTWPSWLQFTLGQTLTYGNSISIIERDSSGRPVALHPIPWQGIQVQLLASGRIAFDCMIATFPWSTVGTPLRRIFEDECFWLRARSDDSYLGKSVLGRAPMVLKQALGLQSYATTLYENSAVPSGVLKHPGTLSPEAKNYITESFSKFQGAHNAGKVPVLEEGLAFDKMSMTPEDFRSSKAGA